MIIVNNNNNNNNGHENQGCQGFTFLRIILRSFERLMV